MLQKEKRPYLRNISDQAYSGLRTDKLSPLWWTDLGYEDTKCHEGPGPRPPPALPSIFLALEKELHYIINTLGPQENSQGLGLRLLLSLPSMFLGVRRSDAILHT